MCLIAVSLQQHPRLPLVIVANRDEFHARPTKPLHQWTDLPEVFAGRDLLAGGTWMGVTSSGRIAALTNYREPTMAPDSAPSRGELVTQWLAGTDATGGADWHPPAGSVEVYAGFNLLLGHVDASLWYHSNRHGSVELTQGTFAVSNGALDSPWPKVTGLRQDLATLLAAETAPSVAALFALLEDRAVAPDDTLPDTGVPRIQERLLSPRMITSDEYGTRAQTVILYHSDRTLSFYERQIDAGGHKVDETAIHLEIPVPPNLH